LKKSRTFSKNFKNTGTSSFPMLQWSAKEGKTSWNTPANAAFLSLAAARAA